jgi:SAM-dependent methyltransferase
MEGYHKETYGASWAPDYDEIFATVTGAMIERMVEFGSGGRVLELAIGTGRVAFPLVERGVDLTGIDISREMVERLRTKPGGDRIPVVMGDFSEVPVEGNFRLVYLVFNTLFALEDQEAQIRCFANVAAHLEPGGRFVTETFFPDLTRFDRGQRFGALAVEVDEVQVEASRHDRTRQSINTQRIHFREDGLKMYPVRVRYAWPAEMDLMARLAGLELESRWGGWEREPFDHQSQIHVSVYHKPD